MKYEVTIIGTDYRYICDSDSEVLTLGYDLIDKGYSVDQLDIRAIKLW